MTHIGLIQKQFWTTNKMDSAQWCHNVRNPTCRVWLNSKQKLNKQTHRPTRHPWDDQLGRRQRPFPFHQVVVDTRDPWDVTPGGPSPSPRTYLEVGSKIIGVTISILFSQSWKGQISYFWLKNGKKTTQISIPTFRFIFCRPYHPKRWYGSVTCWSIHVPRNSVPREFLFFFSLK